MPSYRVGDWRILHAQSSAHLSRPTRGQSVHSPKRSATHGHVGACDFKFACSTISHSPLNLSKSHFTLLPSNRYHAARDDFPHAGITVAYHHGLIRTEPNDFSNSGVTHHFHALGRAG